MVIPATSGSSGKKSTFSEARMRSCASRKPAPEVGVEVVVAKPVGAAEEAIGVPLEGAAAAETREHAEAEAEVRAAVVEAVGVEEADGGSPWRQFTPSGMSKTRRAAPTTTARSRLTRRIKYEIGAHL